MRVRDYTESVYALYTEGVDIDTLMKNLVATLSRRGHERLLPKILSQLLHVSEKEGKRNEVTIILANAAHEALLADDIKKALSQLGKSQYTVRIDPTITGGFIAESTEARIDRSYKKQLLTTYRSLIK